MPNLRKYIGAEACSVIVCSTQLGKKLIMRVAFARTVVVGPPLYWAVVICL